MRVCVTGGSGFLGQHLTKELVNRSYDVVAPTSKDYDLRETALIKMVLNKFNPHVVIHLAARVGGIGANMQYPATFFYDNAVMGLHLIEQSRIYGVKKFVQIGTVCSYPKFTSVPFKEEDIWNGYPEETNAPYGLAKKMLLVQLQAYRKQYGFNGIYIIPTNLYGPLDNFDLAYSHVIPALIRKCIEATEKNSDKIVLWGTGKPTRDFLFVEDAARGIVDAMELYNDAEPINLGTGQEVSILDLVSMIAKIAGFQGEIVFDKSKPDGQPRRCIDTARAKEKINWKPKISLEEGLKRTIDWYRKQVNVNPGKNL
jgi:nucleoside-diphosphate-sugar epimerase